MEALILEETKKLTLGGITLSEPLGRALMCGSTSRRSVSAGRIFTTTSMAASDRSSVNAPMVLGHEASGIISEVGGEVTTLQVGDRVCMEPGIPDPNSRASRLGLYNLDPAVRFWATPPVHGILRPSVVHPADYTFKIPDNVSFAEAAMVEPLAVGMQAGKESEDRARRFGRRHGGRSYRHGSRLSPRWPAAAAG